MSDRFSREALEWDRNADINLINETVAASVLPDILSPSDTVLELGCGTGILSFKYYGSVAAWVGIDTSGGMIDVFRGKVPPGAGSRVRGLEMFLERPDQVVDHGPFSYGVSAMTFHHIPDMAATLACLAGCVDRGLLIVDYLAWDGSAVFHPDDKMEGVERHGLEADEMARLCREAGFAHVDTSIGFTLTLDRLGKQVEFPFLVVHARHAQ
ncbi:protein of unknown function [Taphrina deformans PYCC 5710]|uniref:Methyltransferase domain-containing protein n=1 Tax=Taphrina deformans (strain PYCC 5710 / ATCC 11124 / CBS 356.35 / IMI 108563 / JCM 9778 / NBRC 8474) TaxID=1097556 RepID=R4XF60_TAPDE|nr:protein of unknown function [Taphrina deformans PYCC 5710]|eukprot:CCG84416.1 protein of unknown function [Taphrina deformans PYCC 5710]